jgi:multidrug resistance protein
MADAGSVDEQREHSRLVLYLVSLGLVLVALNHRAIQIALPTLTHVFHTDLSFIQWVLLVYDLAVIALVLTVGRLGDLFGRKWFYIGGFLIFTISSALCGLAQNPVQLIGFRVIQGIGGAMIMANGRALVSINTPASERGKALGLTSTAFHVGYMAGPMLGGFIIDSIGWRWIFHLNIPLGLASAYFAWKVLRERPRSKEPVKIDFYRRHVLIAYQHLFRLCIEPVTPHRSKPSGSVFVFYVLSRKSLVVHTN